jgi:peptidoglycan/LPS O-acetylase OafA/YrhL
MSERLGSPDVRSGFFIPSLDGLRGLAVLLVFFYHALPAWPLPGGLGVTVFFFLSGFLITTLLRREIEASRTIGFWNFYLRRALRILPLFYLVLVVTGLFKLWLEPEGLNVRAMIAIGAHLGNYWGILQGWGGMPAASRVVWSLAIEEHFYLLFPAFLLILTRVFTDRRRQALAVVALCAIVLTWRCYLVWHLHVPRVRVSIASDTRIDSILFGCALALWGNPILDRTRISARTWLGIFLPLSLTTISICFLGRLSIAFGETVRYSLESVALIPIFVTAVRYPSALPFRWLNGPTMTYFGSRSYSLYLIHLGVLGSLSRLGTPTFLLAPVGLLVSLAASELAFLIIEAPCARLRAKLAIPSGPANLVDALRREPALDAAT